MDVEKGLLDDIRNYDNNISELQEMNKEIHKKYGDDSISCKMNHGNPQYYIGGKYASKSNMEKIKALSQRDYNIKAIKEIKGERDRISAALRIYQENPIDDVYNNMCESKKEVVIPVRIPNSDFVEKWMSQEYEQNNRWEEVTTEIYTIKGERVRSKAEKIIADELAAHKIPYRYEYPLMLKVGKDLREFRPDFTALNVRTRREYVIEHLGMMDKVGYYNNNLSKLDILERNGYIIGENLLIFHETYDNPVSIPVIRRYIDTFLI